MTPMAGRSGPRARKSIRLRFAVGKLSERDAQAAIDHCQRHPEQWEPNAAELRELDAIAKGAGFGSWQGFMEYKPEAGR